MSNHARSGCGYSLEVQTETGEKHAAVTRIANQLGIGTKSLRQGEPGRRQRGRRAGTTSADATRRGT